MSKINTDDFLHARYIADIKRIVIKIGSATLTHVTGRLNLRRIESLVKTIADIKNAGKEIVLVSSGAVSAGAGKLGMNLPLADLSVKRAASAVGQVELMSIYDRLFGQYGINVSQLLFTRDVVDIDARRILAEETINGLIGLDSLPVMNENDAVSSDELKFSGNDILSAYAVKLSRAGLLINLTDKDGLYDKNPSEHPDATLIREVDFVTPEVLSYAGGAGSDRGTGGMVTKLRAAEMIAEYKVPMIIASGRDPEILYDIVEGNIRGTLIHNGGFADRSK
ncbi:glutamate 5-kinase [Clostridia bacterium]|nr:glutamate 5-kinase [Clostridia bacterium]